MLDTICKQSYVDNLSNVILWESLYPYRVITGHVYPAHIDSETILQTDRARSSRLPIPLSDDPYMAVGQSYLATITDSECEPFEDSREIEIPQPLPIAPSPIPPSDDPYLIYRTYGRAYSADLIPKHVSQNSGGNCFVSVFISQEEVPVVDIATDEPLGLGYEALRRRELALRESSMPSTFEIGRSSRSMSEQHRVEETSTPRSRVHATWTPPSLEWSSGSLPVLPSSLVVPTSVASPATTLVATIVVDEDEFLERNRLRSLEQEQERAIVTFGAIWRPVLALESWVGYVDAQRAEMWRARYDDHRLMHNLLVHNTTMQSELQEIRDCVTILEREGSRRGQ
nr:hypothetical protein [Tanacetum cinerariifolium]